MLLTPPRNETTQTADKQKMKQTEICMRSKQKKAKKGGIYAGAPGVTVRLQIWQRGGQMNSASSIQARYDRTVQFASHRAAPPLRTSEAELAAKQSSQICPESKSASN